ncbi:MAG TPA: aspartate aminotransferase family protein [Bryobacteraceae bacterium]|nr:aspartate aminotransferase family protein [Bryobacteraceae bacterium]
MSALTTAAAEVSADAGPVELEKQYLLQNYARYPLLLTRGRGCYVWDDAGNKYLDLIAGIGVNALGHAHPRITKVIREQAARIVHTSNLYYHDYQGPLAKKLAEKSGLARSFFTNSGTESMEGAIKMIRAHGSRLGPEKIEIISLENSFHGRSTGALAITGQHKYRKDFEPLLPGVRFVPLNDVGALEQAVTPRTAGVVLECIQGEGGIYAITPAYLRRARELCDRHDALLVFDEIQSGVGRPGTYFSYQLAEPTVLPDITVVAKPLGCGLPIGAIIANEKAAATIGPGMHGSTFGGNALACRVALEFFDILEELLPSIVNVGNYFRARLIELARRHSFVKEVRGAGLMIGMELTHPCRQLVLDGIKAGLLFNCTHDTVLRFLPAYILSEKEVDRAVSGLKKLFRAFNPN